MAGTDSCARVALASSAVHALRMFLHAAPQLFPVTLWSLCATILMTGHLGAQAITGTLVEAETGAPIEGAAVTLLSRGGERLGWRLTDAAGKFDFRMTRGGTFLLRADRIGHASITSDPIPVDRGVTAVYLLETPVEAIRLEGINVRSSRRCQVRPDEGVSTATVWDEARKALEATSRTSGLGTYQYLIRHFERELDARGRRVLSEQSRLQSAKMSTPFRTLNIESLLERGFVHADDEGSTFYAPDADILLSDPFLDTHCMSLTTGRGEAEGLIGLSFEPTRDRGVPDISGVLWLDRESAELQWLDYRYEFLDVPDADRLGGQVRFDGLPNGAWIVREWYIRMPLLEASVRRRRPRLVGLRDEGGLVVSVSEVDGDIVLDAAAGIIEGIVFESEGTDPAEEVVVALDDGQRATTDEDGRFRLTSLAEGYYGLRVVNPALDSLGLSASPVFFEVAPGEVTSARLRFPSLDAVMMERCTPDDLSDYEGILVGFAVDERGNPTQGARISAAWDEVERRGGSVGTVEHVLTSSELPDNGFFVLCGLPRDRRVEITGVWNGRESRPDRFFLSERQRVTRRDIMIRGRR